jgi:hypothetical protein
MLKRTLTTIGLIIISAVICSAQSAVYFPQFVDGTPDGFGFWGSVIAVTNAAAPGTPVANGTISVNKDDGTLVNMTFADENLVTTPSTFQLAGGQTKLFFSPMLRGTGLLPYTTGFATVSSDLPVTAGLVFIEGDLSNGVTSQAGVQGVTPIMRQATVAVRNITENTGIAVAYPGSGTANVTFQLLDKSGTLLVPQVTRGIAGNNHSAFFITDLFPNLPSSVAGTLRITSDKPIVTTALLITPKGQLATIPTFPLQ